MFRNMKYFLKIMLAYTFLLVIVLALTSCNKGTNEITSTTEAIEKSTATTKATTEVENSEVSTTKATGSDNRCSHIYEKETIKKATCTQEGEVKYTCSKCGDSYTVTVAKTEHDYYVNWVSYPTCTESGEKRYICSNCKHTYTETVSATGHTYSGDKCTVCGASNPNYVAPSNTKTYTEADAQALVQKLKTYGESQGLTWDTSLNEDNAGYNTTMCGLGVFTDADRAYNDGVEYLDFRVISYNAKDFYIVYSATKNGYNFRCYYL